MHATVPSLFPAIHVERWRIHASENVPPRLANDTLPRTLLTFCVAHVNSRRYRGIVTTALQTATREEARRIDHQTVHVACLLLHMELSFKCPMVAVGSCGTRHCDWTERKFQWKNSWSLSSWHAVCAVIKRQGTVSRSTIGSFIRKSPAKYNGRTP